MTKRSDSHSVLLNLNQLSSLASTWINEDIPAFDVQGAVVGDQIREARLLAKSSLVIAGYPFFEEVFKQLDCKVTWEVEEGALLEGSNDSPVQVATVCGSARHVLQGERTALNVITRCSAIASYARRVVDIAREKGYKGEVVGTRKTTPGFRIVEKYGLLVGGAGTHRFDLSSMTMLKDNHIDACGSITSAVKTARGFCGFSQKIEVECRTQSDAMEAAEAGADVVMLDNFSPSMIAQVSAAVKDAYPHICIEASGGITHHTIGEYAAASSNGHVDVISMGALTQWPESVDISLKLRKSS